MHRIVLVIPALDRMGWIGKSCKGNHPKSDFKAICKKIFVDFQKSKFIQNRLLLIYVLYFLFI
jgi:hypothetical protein